MLMSKTFLVISMQSLLCSKLLVVQFQKQCHWSSFQFNRLHSQQIKKMIESTNLIRQLAYICRHNNAQTIEYLKGYLNAAQLQQNRRVSSSMLEFEVTDQYETKMLLKTAMEVQMFLQWYNSKFNKSLTIEMLQNDRVEFPEIKGKQMNSNRLLYQFMEVQHHQIFHYKSENVERKFREKRWHDKLFCCCNKSWEECMILVTKKGILQKNQHGEIIDFLLFTAFFETSYGLERTGQVYGIEFSSIHRNILIKLPNCQSFYQFAYYINKAMSRMKEQKSQHGSSSFVRKYNKLDFIVDGKQYFESVAKAIEEAKVSILISGWWISPELPLIRPVNSDSSKYRLDRLLKRKAQQNVVIYILVFNSPPVVPNNSTHTQLTLRKLHHNIHILSYPSNIIPTVWSHHEKNVIIDQKIGFIGGLDLCFGRYDDNSHPINSNSHSVYPGIQYNNVRIKDFTNVRQFNKSDITRDQPRLPWHDVAVRFQGQSVVDLTNHFIEYWNQAYLEAFVIQDNFKKVKNIPKQSKLQNPQHKSKNAKKYEDLSTQRQALIKQRKSKIQSRLKVSSIVKEYNLEKKKDPAQEHHLVIYPHSVGIIKKQKEQWQQTKKEQNHRCQLLRSASEWSVGLDNGKIESSIHQAYLYLIENAKHFIYIENQFFISVKGHSESNLQNQIAEALYQRIKRAVKKQQTFKVIVFMPLLPGMEGYVDQNLPLTLKMMIYWQYQSISRGEKSLLTRLSKITDEPGKYIRFYGLRQHGLLQNNPKTEMIYIHTKMMIVDDQKVIVGSANINDRSMLGDRDCELALLFEQGDKIGVKLNKQKTEVNLIAHQLRVRLLCQHFSIQPEECEDLLSQEFDKLTSNISSKNTQIYRELFGCYPDDNIKKLQETKGFEKVPSVEDYQIKSRQIQGHAVQFPLNYLSGQNLETWAPEFIDDVMT